MSFKRFECVSQGLGKLGAALAQLLVDHGAICVGVKETDGYIYEPDGINLNDLFEHREKTGSILNFGPCKPDTKDVIYTEQCDVLIFAGYQKSLNCYVADNVQAKVVLEAADCPISPSAHRILTGRKKIVIPDIYSCSGATVASYIEYLRNMLQIHGNKKDIFRFSRNIYENIIGDLAVKENVVASCGPSVISSTANRNFSFEQIEWVLSDTGNEIIRLANLHSLGTDLRTAAYILGIENIFNTMFYQRKFF